MIREHVEKESTSTGTLQRDFQSFDHMENDLLRGNGQRQMEHGFGVAGLNCRKRQISSDGTACYSGGYCIADALHAMRDICRGLGCKAQVKRSGTTG